MTRSKKLHLSYRELLFSYITSMIPLMSTSELGSLSERIRAFGGLIHVRFHAIHKEIGSMQTYMLSLIVRI